MAQNNTNQQNLQFSENELKRVQEYISRYPEGKHKSALLPLLHMAQEKWGWCSVPVMDYVATLLNIKPIEVYEVATFYTMFHLEPVGKFVLEYCHTGPCALRGAEKILDYIKKKENIEVGGTSADGVFTLKTVECLASCGSGPMMQVGDYYYEDLTEQKIDELFAKWRADAPNVPEHFAGNSL